MIPPQREWELIIKYSGALDEVRKIAVSVTELLNGYAVLVIKEDLIGELCRTSGSGICLRNQKAFIFVKRMPDGQASCIDEVQNPPLSLSGRGVLIGIVDSGIDYENPRLSK